MIFKFEHMSGVQPKGWDSDEDWPDNILVEAANKEEAIDKFKKKFGIDPLNTTCPCCGTDYAIKPGVKWTTISS